VHELYKVQMLQRIIKRIYIYLYYHHDRLWNPTNDKGT